ncbi:hypothetical protein [Brevundimonas sp.]|uniref:hypothetical protein n=1 Tax=Brevundimonas sp. TaxID=1871086 RepID=UPI0037BEECBE
MSQTTVNPQIKDAVESSTNWAMGFAKLEDGTSLDVVRVSAGAAIAYDKATQAAALAAQDAADYQRNMLSISTTVQGKAMAMMLASSGMSEPALIAYAMALVSSLAAPIAAGMAAESVAKVLPEFPRH